MELIYELIEIFDLFHLEQIEYSQINLPSASKEKITAIINLYQSLNKNIPQHKCYQYEDILFDQIDENLSNNHYIFITDKIFYQLRFQFINKLAKFNDITILINDYDDSRNLNTPFKRFHKNDYYTDFNHPFLKHLNTYLFSLQSPKYLSNSPLHSLIQTTPKAQIESVVLNIYQNIVDKNKHYHDFAIYYPNQEYLDLLIETLNNFNIPHNIKKTLVFKEMDACLLWLKYCCNNDDNDLLDLLDTKIINGFIDYNYLDMIKKRYIETGYIKNPFIDKYDISNCHILTEFSDMMINFINNEIIYNQNQTILINFFKNLRGEQFFTIKEFYNLVTKLKPILKEDKKIYNDHLYLLNYNQCYSGILECSYIYLVGVNETIVPVQTKDTGILLDHDYRILNLPDLNHQIALNQNSI